MVASEGPDDIELLLEPNNNPAARTYQQSIYEQGIPITASAVDDVRQETDRLKIQGVRLQMEPTSNARTLQRYSTTPAET